MVPQYSSLISSRIHDEYQNRQVPNEYQASTSDEAFFSSGAGCQLIQVLESVTTPKEAQSAKTFFSHQNATGTGFDKF